MNPQSGGGLEKNTNVTVFPFALRDQPFVQGRSQPDLPSSALHLLFHQLVKLGSRGTQRSRVSLHGLSAGSPPQRTAPRAAVAERPVERGGCWWVSVGAGGMRVAVVEWRGCVWEGGVAGGDHREFGSFRERMPVMFFEGLVRNPFQPGFELGACVHVQAGTRRGRSGRDGSGLSEGGWEPCCSLCLQHVAGAPATLAVLLN